MNNRILIAGLLGGLALFAWEFVAHDLTPLGEAGVSTMPNEAAVRAALKQQIPTGGMYYFPAPADMSRDAVSKATEEARTGPTGLMVFFPNGARTFDARQLTMQFVLDAASMLIAAWLLSQAPIAGFGGRLLFVIVLGTLPGLRSHLPLWNWYHFPKTYALAAIAMDVIGFGIAGVIVVKLTQRRLKTMAAAS